MRFIQILIGISLITICVAIFAPIILWHVVEQPVVEVVEQDDNYEWLNRAESTTQPPDVIVQDGTDQLKGFEIDITNRDSTINYIYGIHIDEIVPDASASATAIFVGEGWECLLMTVDGCILKPEDLPKSKHRGW